MDSLIKDLRFAVRSLLKRPGFTVVALITLALGIGVNTALFTLFNIFLRPKPIKDPATVVRLEYQGQRREDRFTYQDYVYFRDRSKVFSEVLANFQDQFLLGEATAGVEPEELLGNFVSDNYLSTFGGQTQLGRFFTREENSVPGRDALVVLSDGFWQRRFGGDSQIIGRTILLNGKPFTVIGVTDRRFVGLRYDVPDIWLPLMMRPALATAHFEQTPVEDRDWFGNKGFGWLTLNARLKPGRSAADARSELAVLTSQLPSTGSENEPRSVVDVVPITNISGDNEVWVVMLAVLGASGLVLLIACSNIANMLLARAAARQKEIVIRLCLGASRGRVVRQLLTESFLLAAFGGVAGVLLAWWSLSLFLNVFLTRYGGGEVSRLVVDLSPDLRVLGFALLLSVLSSVAFGLVPALRATNQDLFAVIKNEGGGSRSARSLLRNGLVVAQVSLCLVLLIAAGLLLRSVSHVLALDPGFDAKRLINVGYSLELSDYDDKRAQLFQQQLISRLSALPGVESVSVRPVFGGRATIKLGDSSNGASVERVPFEWVTANFLQTLGTRIVQGRGFTTDEQQTKAPVIVVSESTARNLWPDANPLGKTVHIEQPLRDGNTELVFSNAQVIGVAQDSQLYRVGQIPSHFFYATQPQIPEWLDTQLFVRTSSEASSLKVAVRKEAYALEPVLRLKVRTMAERMAADSGLGETRAASELASGLGGLALLLAAIGIYGVMAWTVAQRTREIGIRMALGAQGRDVMRLVLRQGMDLAFIGVAIGVGLSLAVTQLMKSMLFGLSPVDPVTYVGVSALLSFVALLACYIPARRATSVDPTVALRYE